MCKIKLHVYDKEFKYKPSTDDIAKLKKPLQSEKCIQELTISKLKQELERGKTISPAVMNGGKKSDWKSQQLFMVDIDNKDESNILTIKNAIEICEKYDLPIAFVYETFSSTVKIPRYRLAFISDKIIENIGFRNIIQTTLVNMFPNSDKSCINEDRIFFGTNKTVELLKPDVTFSEKIILKISEDFLQLEPKKVERYNASVSSYNTELDGLKRNFDFLGYITQNYSGKYQNYGDYMVFKDCPICGHHDDFIFYVNTNSFYCFGANGNVGGSVIDFLMVTKKLDLNQAISYLKYELCGIRKEGKIMAKEKQAFLVYHEWQDPVNSLSDENAGKLFKAIFNFNVDGENPQFTSKDIEMLFSIMKGRFKKDRRSWEKKIEECSKAGKMSASMRKNGNSEEVSLQ